MGLVAVTLTVVLALCGGGSVEARLMAPPSRWASADPPLTVPRAQLASALHCQRTVRNARAAPVLLLPGTGSDGAQLYPTGLQPELSADGMPSCLVNLPDHTTGDMQTSAEYVVFALRKMSKRSHRRVVVYGFSQGGVLARLALTFWPSTRSVVTDVVSAAAPQHGSTVSADCPTQGCSAANWQRRTDSRLLMALNRGDESPGPTAWTTVRTLDDAIAQPVDGDHPTSALQGATNLVLQQICPDRQVDHLTMSFDAVVYAVLRDAATHRGPARAARLPRKTCDKLFVGESPADQRRAQIAALSNTISATNAAAAQSSAEPPVRIGAQPRRRLGRVGLAIATTNVAHADVRTPCDLVVGPDDDIWFTSLNSNRVGFVKVNER
jgi:triacylglycerol lipase